MRRAGTAHLRETPYDLRHKLKQDPTDSRCSMPAMGVDQFEKCRWRRPKNREIERVVALVPEHLALCRQLIFAMRRQKDQQCPAGGVAPERMLRHSRAPARAETPESGCAKTFETYYHPASFAKQELAFAIGLILEIVA